jgi:hypothetical protein
VSEKNYIAANSRIKLSVVQQKVCAALASNMQFYFYRIDRKVMGTK